MFEKYDKIKHGGDVNSYIKKYGKLPHDFSSNLSFFDYSDRLEKVYIDSFNKCFFYPDEIYSELVKEIAAFENVKNENIAVSNGASELITLLPFILQSRKTLICAPTFIEYKERFSKHSEVFEYKLNPNNSFMIENDIYKIIKNFDTIILVNPNNPVGNVLTKKEIKKIIEKCEINKSYLIVDECFMDLSIKNESAKKYLEKYDKLIIIKALTKSFSLAGIRLGYLISNEEIIYKVNSFLPSWRVSNIADIIGREVLKYKDDLKKIKKEISKELGYLSEELKNMGFKVFPSETNFILFKSDIKDFKDKMELEGFLIRDCSNYTSLENGGYYRIAVKNHNENVLLIKAIQKIVKMENK